MSKQIETVSTTYRATLRSKHFNIGVSDVVNNKGWNSLYETWDTRNQWNYERGRLYAIYTKGEIPVKKDRTVRSDAIYAYMNASFKKAII